jgi:bisphosphoglycerate-independent phosphoglycerate mutase (AlkP superfamily)
VDPESVPGILFMNRALIPGHGSARIIDLAPTILKHLGVAAPESMEGASLL